MSIIQESTSPRDGERGRAREPSKERDQVHDYHNKNLVANQVVCLSTDILLEGL
jgi:hypothetical protein